MGLDVSSYGYANCSGYSHRLIQIGLTTMNVNAIPRQRLTRMKRVALTVAILSPCMIARAHVCNVNFEGCN